VPELAGLRMADAQSIIDSFLARMPGGGWLSAEEGDALLRCYGLPMVEFRRAADADAAVEAAAGLGGHVVIKADVAGLLHKSVAGAVELDLSGPDEVRAAMHRLQAAFAGRMSGVLVEPMVTGGVETIVGVVQEPVFGPVVVFGLGGVATDVLGDHAARLAPLTDADADDLIHSIRAALSLLGRQGRPAADVGAVRDTLLRVSRLADDLPQVAELDLNPVIARPDGVVAVDARIRVTSHRLADPFLRQLPLAAHGLGIDRGATYDRTCDQQTRLGAAPARPRAAAPRPRPDRPGVRAAAGRGGARPRRAHVGRAPQPRVQASLR
jgi:acyl-CoA synthetase (NDP forming)